MRISRLASGLAAAAALSLTASPVLADGWGGYGHRRHHNDDTGWIVGGILGLGLIAAIAASSSNKSRRDSESRERDYRYPDNNYRDGQDARQPGTRYGDAREDDRPDWSGSSRNIDGAVNACVSEVERRNSARVDTVDSVGREADGWRIRGRVADGGDFSCAVDSAQRVSGVTVAPRRGG